MSLFRTAMMKIAARRGVVLAPPIAALQGDGPFESARDDAGRWLLRFLEKPGRKPAARAPLDALALFFPARFRPMEGEVKERDAFLALARALGDSLDPEADTLSYPTEPGPALRASMAQKGGVPA